MLIFKVFYYVSILLPSLRFVNSIYRFIMTQARNKQEYYLLRQIQHLYFLTDIVLFLRHYAFGETCNARHLSSFFLSGNLNDYKNKSGLSKVFD